MIHQAKSNPQLLDVQIFSERLHPRFLLSAAISGIMLCNKSRVDDAGAAHSIALIGRG
jgi:hypothetical protein